MQHYKIVTPKNLLSQRGELTKQIVELIKQQQRSCHRYAKRINALHNKLVDLDKQLGE